MNHFPLLNQVTLYVLVKCVLGGLGGKISPEVDILFSKFLPNLFAAVCITGINKPQILYSIFAEESSIIK